MNSPLLAATFLSLCTIASLVGMLLSGGWFDLLFFATALAALAWGAGSAWRSRAKP